ncbi:MAG: UDP-N-acetylmuramoyl-tripeptide--D-alanyl-D-alanine ligase [Chloroflexaceae bacterium]|nr:UDP-N-acetylmuramoyl-tripeptide--D-alanyl-D-alanine ligase [Chloroflexaceae bacterium]
MTLPFSLALLSKILGLPAPTTEAELSSFPNLSTDTRTLQAGDIFVALRGETFDGHDFLEAAARSGAIAAIIAQDYAGTCPEMVLLRVADPLGAYQQLAQWWRDRFEIPAIAVTGSVGKTTTKELIAAVLQTQGSVLKTQANYNNEIGVPKTLLGLREYHDYAVIEMAMRARGEIALLSQIARPTIGVITNVGTAHIGRLGSREAIAAAKCELLAEMPKSSIAVLNGDDPLLLATAKQVWSGEVLTYGLEGGDLQGEIQDTGYLRLCGQRLPLPLPGRHNALNYLAALAVAKCLGIDWSGLMEGVVVNLPKGRSQRYVLSGDVVILDETYNAGLESMLAALDLLKETPGERHIAVLGTMKELGEQAEVLHRQVGNKAKALQLDYLLVLVDERAAEGILAGAAGMERSGFSDRDSLVKYLLTLVKTGDRILFKASNSVGLHWVVEQFRAAWEQPGS